MTKLLWLLKALLLYPCLTKEVGAQGSTEVPQWENRVNTVTSMTPADVTPWNLLNHVIVYEKEAATSYDGAILRHLHDPNRVFTILSSLSFAHTRYEHYIGAAIVTAIEKFCSQEEG